MTSSGLKSFLVLSVNVYILSIFIPTYLDFRAVKNWVMHDDILPLDGIIRVLFINQEKSYFLKLNPTTLNHHLSE